MDELNLLSASALGRSAHRIRVVERRYTVAKKQNDSKTGRTVSVQLRLHQRAREIQSYGTVKHALPLDLEEPVRVQVTNQLNQLLADTMTLRDYTRSVIGRSLVRRSIKCTCCTISIMVSRTTWLI